MASLCTPRICHTGLGPRDPSLPPLPSAAVVAGAAPLPSSLSMSMQGKAKGEGERRVPQHREPTQKMMRRHVHMRLRKIKRTPTPVHGTPRQRRRRRRRNPKSRAKARRNIVHPGNFCLALVDPATEDSKNAKKIIRQDFGSLDSVCFVHNCVSRVPHTGGLGAKTNMKCYMRAECVCVYMCVCKRMYVHVCVCMCMCV
jgi:hypothetical protein